MVRSTRQHDKSFFWTLLSNSDSSNYPQNIPSDFLTQFPLPNGSLDRENYEVGLVDIKYLPHSTEENNTPTPTSSSQPPAKRGRISPTPEPVVESGPFFENLELNEPEIIEIIKETTEVETFFAYLATTLLPKKVSILRENYMEEDSAFATIKFETLDTNQILVLPDEIAEMLGFNQRFFLPGSTSAYGKVDYSKFEAIEMNEEFNVYIHTLKPSYKENLLKITTKVEYIEKFSIDFEKGHNDAVDLVNHIQRRFTENRFIPFEIAVGLKREDGVRKLDSTSIINFTGRNPNEQVILPEILARGLGFTTNVFSPGEHTSTNEANSELFADIANGSELDFKFIIPYNFDIPMDEPDDRELSSIVSEINRALVRFGIPMALAASGDDIEPRMKPSDTIQLPPKINQFLKLDASFVINSTRRSIKQTPVPEAPEEPVFERSDELTVAEVLNIVQVRVRPKLMLVSCSAASNQFFGNQQYPLLRVLDLSEEYIRETHSTFSPILYVPVQTDNISQVRIQLLDEYGNLLNLGKNPVRLTLHFKVID